MKRLQVSLKRKLASAPAAERVLMRSIAVLAAVLAVALPVAQFIEIDRAVNPDSPAIWGVIVSYTSFWLRVRIGVALSVNSIAIWSFRPKPFVVSMLVMGWVVVEYLLWFIWSLRVRESLGTGHLPEPSSGGLYSANWLDLVVLVLTIGLAGWMVKILASVRIGVRVSTII